MYFEKVSSAAEIGQHMEGTPGITKTLYRVIDFVTWQRDKTLVLSPSFQRRNVWSSQAKSYLIDTVARGLPIPIIFLRERMNLSDLKPLREVVDGQQRLRTLLAFIEPKSLPDFQKGRDDFVVSQLHNKEIAEKPFVQLSQDVRKTILNYEFSTHILPANTDDREVLEIFARLNSTGLRLTGQELRNAKFFGQFKKTAYELAYEQLTRWRQWRVFSESEIARMAEVELVSDLLLTMLQGLRAKSQPALDAIYREKDQDFPERDEAIRRFRLIMDSIEDMLSGQMPSLAYSGQTLFHTVFTFLYDLSFGLNSSFEKRAPRKLPASLPSSLIEVSQVIKGGNLSDELAKALRGRTTHRESRVTRLDFLRQNCVSDTSQP